MVIISERCCIIMKIYDYNGSANIVGKRIREARTKRNMSQEELAIKLQLKNIIIGQKVISRIEKGERFVADYELLGFSEVLNVDLYWLFDIDK